MAELVATALWEIGGATLTEAAIFVASNAAYINAAVAFSASALNANHQRKKAARQARDAYNASLQDRFVMQETAQGARDRVYGRVRKSGGVVFKATHGTNKEFYTLVISLAGHEIDGVEQIYFDDVPVSLDGSGYVQTGQWSPTATKQGQDTITVAGGSGSRVLAHTPIAGSVVVTYSQGWGESLETYAVSPTVVGTTVSVAGAPIDGTWSVSYQYVETSSKARVRTFLGGASQNLYTELQALVGSAVVSTDKFAWDACLLCTLEFDPDAFPSGPPAVSAVVRGAKIYDWRTGLTAFSENPSVIARDWALYSYGGGCTIDEIVLPAFTTAANTSDVSTTFVSSSGTEVRPLYQCGIVIPLDANPDEAMNEIVESMAGKWGWAGGRLTLRAGAYRAPVATIDESWITDVDRVQIVGETATAELINTMRPTIADAAQAYVPVPLADVSAAAFVSADGGDLPLEVELGGVTRAVQAQNICGVLMRENREGLTVTLPCNLRAYPLELFDVVALNLPTFGWANKEVEVQGWSFSLTGGVSLTVREIVAGNYTPDALFRVSTVSNNTYLLDPTQVETLSITSIDSSATGLVDGSLVARVKLTWTAAVAESVRRGGQIEIQYIEAGGASSAGDWQAAPLERGSVTSTTIGGLKMGVNYLFRIRAYNALGVKGRWSLHSLHQVTAAQLETWQLTNEAATTVLTDADPGPISLGRLSVPNIPGAQAAVDLPVLTRAVRVRVTATFNTRLTNGATAINGVSAYLSIIDTGTGVGFSGNKVQFPNVGSSPWPCAPTPVASATVEGVTTITHTFDYDPTVDNPRTVLLTAGLEGTTPTSASASLYSLSFNVEVIKA